MSTYHVKLERSTPLILPTHPDAPSSDGFQEWCAKEKASGQLLAVDLFSGAGGLGAGVEAAGWTVVAAVDHDHAALETHRSNFRGLALDIDMAEPDQVSKLISRLEPIGVDLVAGGPPCQPFSRAGRAKIRSLVNKGVRSEKDIRKDLWRSFIEVVVNLRPRSVLMENVPDMAIGDDLTVIREIASILEELDYLVDYRLLDAWRFGVPQHRKRFILQARNDGVIPIWPQSAKTKPTVRDAIGDLPNLNGTTGARELHYPGQPTSTLAKSLRGDIKEAIIYDHMTRPVRDDDRKAFELMTPSTRYSDLPKHLQRYRSDIFDDKYKRLGWNELSRTITAHIAKDGYWYIHPEENRTLTIREAARLQTFPDHFRFAGTRSDAFRQIGNAVPPILGRFVAESILPVDSPRREISYLPIHRESLTKWAKNERKTRWWLYPGPDMTLPAAAFSSLFNVHRMPTQHANRIMTPLKGAVDLTSELLEEIDTDILSKARKNTFKALQKLLKSNGETNWIHIIVLLMSESQKQIYSLLQGQDTLILNKHVSEIVALLMDLPDNHKGLRTDIKVALAQLVSTGCESTLRMSAIRTISLQDTHRYILNSSNSIEGS